MTQGNRQVSLYFLENVRDKTLLLVMTKAQQFEKIKTMKGFTLNTHLDNMIFNALRK